MQRGNVVKVRIPSATFNTGINHGGNSQLVDFAMPESIAAGRHCRARILEIRLWTSKLIKYGVQIYSKSGLLGGAAIDAETYLGEWQFGNTGNPGDGSKPTGFSFFYYYINGQDITYQDDDKTGKLHLALVNWDGAVDKLAGDTVVIELAMEPLQGI